MFPVAATLVAAILLAASPSDAVGVDQHLFTNGLVLQRGMPVPIWGTASAGEQVTVTFAGQNKTTTAASDGTWRITLDPLVANAGPLGLIIQGTNQIALTGVMVGEVWLCGGQSNMVLEQPGPVRLAANPEVHALRFNDWSDAPGDICWEFALTMHDVLGVPIGIINNAKGGTRIRTWLPPSTIDDPDPRVPEILANYPIWGDVWQEVGVHLVPYAIRGVIWWQGEADSRTANDHRYILPAMIRAWRREWNQGDFPFVYVQLPNGKGLPYGESVRNLPAGSRGSPWAATLRQAFIDTLDVVPNTGMIVTSDLIGGIHPPPQEYPEYAARLADAVLVEVYGEDFTYSGPIVQSATAEGSSVRIRYRPHTADSLQFTGAVLQGFALSADHENWEWADSATIDGNQVVVANSLVPAPVAVRYGFASKFRWANLYNERGMVSGPFQIDVEPAP